MGNPLARARLDPTRQAPRWQASAPLIAAADRDGEHFHGIKDPTVVRDGGRWHIFTTLRGVKRPHQIEHRSVATWTKGTRVRRELLDLDDGYHCALQVFYFRPHRRWYLICQARDPSQKVSLQPAFATARSLSKPGSWSKLTKLFPTHPSSVERWIDFWAIRDDRASHRFFTSNNGKMWRAQTPLDCFPHGWDTPGLVLKDDVFEASHTYRLKGRKGYLTMIGAEGLRIGVRRRYFKSYLAEDLRAPWKPIAATTDQPSAGATSSRGGRMRRTKSSTQEIRSLTLARGQPHRPPAQARVAASSAARPSSAEA